MRASRVSRLLAALLLAAAGFNAAAQGGKPVRILIGFPPGGALDSAARILAEHMTETMKRAVIVEARVGLGGLQGVRALKEAAPDGDTLMIAPGSTTVLRPLSMRKPPFDPFVDLVPVALVGQSPLAIAVHSAIPATTLREWAAWVKSNPNQALYSTGGAGGQTHFFGLMIAEALGISLKHVPYKGTGPAVADVAGGHVPSTVQPLGALLAQHRAKRLRILALSGDKSAAAPDVQTFVEQGFPNLALQAWYAIYAPGATPAPVLERLNGVINQSLRNEGVRKKLFALDLSIPIGSVADAAAFMKKDHERWQPVIKASGFTEDD